MQAAKLTFGIFAHPHKLKSDLLLHHVRHSLNKSAIYVGGYLSLHFGLISQRIVTSPRDAAHVNEHWVRPPPPVGRRNVGGYL
jgi:hypothetical protein